MSTPEDIRFLRNTARKIGNRGMIRARRNTPSKTLRDAMRFEPGTIPGHGKIHVPHYWAVYVHDGRMAPFSARRARFLVWFRNPKDDPRLRNGVTPERARDLRRLTKQEFRFWLARNRAAVRAGQPTPMVIVRQVRRSTQGWFFFDNRPGAMGELIIDAARIIERDFSVHIRNRLGPFFQIKDSATIRM